MSRVPGDVVIDLKRVPMFKAALVRAVDVGIGRAAVVFEGAAKQSIRGGGAADGVGAGKVWGRRSMPGNFPRSQSGQLRNSITSERESWAKYKVGTNVAHGKYMEFGSNPRAKNGKYLAIPLNYEASRLQKRAGSRGLRGIPGLEILAKTKRGYILGWKKGATIQRKLSDREQARLEALHKRGVITGAERIRANLKERGKDKALFALVPSVTILPRPWLLPTMANTGNQREAQEQLNKTVYETVKKALAGGKA